jgi:hypothetical protein
VAGHPDNPWQGVYLLLVKLITHITPLSEL